MNEPFAFRDEMLGIGYLITITGSMIDIQDFVGFKMINYHVLTDHGYEFTISLPDDPHEKTDEYAFSTIKKVIRKMTENSDWIEEERIKNASLKAKKLEVISKKEEKKAAKKK